MAGRPTIIDADVLSKLEQAFALGCTDKEACLFANIAPSTLYNYQIANPEFVERKEELKETPVLKARTTVVGQLDKPAMATWFLERRAPEFKAKSDITSDNAPLTALSESDRSAITELRDLLKQPRA